MSSNLSQGIVQVLGNSVIEINDALRQIQIRIDALKGLSGRAEVHDRVGVSDPTVTGDAINVGSGPTLSADNTFTGDVRFDGMLGHQIAPVDPQTVDAVTNSVTSGGVDGTIANYTDLTTYSNSAAAIRNDIYQLARSVNQIAAALRAYGFGV